MITQELTDYIKGQLSAGLPKEKIINDLSKEGGWDLSNIHEAFANIGNTMPQAETAAVPAVTPNTVAGATVSGVTHNRYWTKSIPWANRGFMATSLILLLGVDLYILVTDSMGLGMETMVFFYRAMFIPMAIFVGFYFYENRILSVKFSNSKSKLDIWFTILVAVRDYIFILSFIPFIQILAFAVLVKGAVPYLIAYYFMMRARNRAVLATV
jgi:hypothetical protein